MRVVSLALLALAVVACSAPPPPPAVAAPPGPRDAPPLPAPTAQPAALPGVGDVELDAREAALFWQLVSELYSPCPSMAVSIAQCVTESRVCAGCRPAARLLAERVRDGASAEQARTAYASRFGPPAHKVDVADSPTRGPAGAAVTIVVFSDFECPYCARMVPVFEKVVDRFAPHVRLVHKFYPLNQHQHAREAARAAIAAQRQGRYWEMERLLFQNQRELEEADLDRYAQQIGLDMKRFHADMSADRTEQILKRDHDAGEATNLQGTPHVLINGREFAHPFRIDRDLDAWISLDLEMAGVKR